MKAGVLMNGRCIRCDSVPSAFRFSLLGLVGISCLPGQNLLKPDTLPLSLTSQVLGKLSASNRVRILCG